MRRALLALLAFSLLGATWTGIKPYLMPGKVAVYSFAAADGTGTSSIWRHECGTIGYGFEDGAGGDVTIQSCVDAACSVPENEAVLTADADGTFVPRYPWIRVQRDAVGAGTSQVFLRCGPNVAVAGAAGGGYATIQDEGAGLAQEVILDCQGAGITCSAGGGKTIVTVPGGGGATPTGTGFRHVTVGVEDAASKLVDTADVNPAQITFAKVQNIATDSLVGRDTAAAGAPENILLNATLEMDGALNLRRAALTGDVTSAAGSNATVVAIVPAAATVAIDGGEVTSGVVVVSRGGTGAAPGLDDQVLVSDSAVAATWRSIPDCGESGTLNYEIASNTFSCLTDAGAGAGLTYADVAWAVMQGAW